MMTEGLASVFTLLRLISFLLVITTGTLTAIEDVGYGTSVTPMHKVLLTQKGYIQFLRWEVTVPVFQEFTFCVWVMSNNLTYSHSIFSYSKNERDRLIRAWIAPQGKSVNLEIGGVEVFQRATVIEEHRWYHLCQSWENKIGRYALWVNGHVEVHGQAEKTRGHIVPSGGDIVLGQEYTDFDKGLEEGIEGEAFGFNLLLASAFHPLEETNLERTTTLASVFFNNQGELVDNGAVGFSGVSFPARIPTEIIQRYYPYRAETKKAFERLVLPSYRFRRKSQNDTDFGRKRSSYRGAGDIHVQGKILTRRTPSYFPIESSEVYEEPLGARLVRLSYVYCQLGRGSPPIDGTTMLISWSRTPVRVFGGATLKNARNDCGNF